MHCQTDARGQVLTAQTLSPVRADYERAQTLFERLLKLDPHRLEQIDAYSNILYVKEEDAKLSQCAIAQPNRDCAARA